MLPFKNRLTLRQRICEYKSILQKKPDHTPVIVNRANRDTPILSNEKYIVPNDLTVSQFMF